MIQQYSYSLQYTLKYYILRTTLLCGNVTPGRILVNVTNLRVFIERSCGQDRREGFDQRRLARVHVAQDAHIDIQNLHSSYAVHYGVEQDTTAGTDGQSMRAR